MKIVVGRALQSLEGILEIRLGLIELQIRPFPSDRPHALGWSLASF